MSATPPLSDDEPAARAVLFADLAGFTALTAAHGDVSAADVARRFCDIARESVQGDAHLVKTIGDAVMIVASDSGSAVDTGIAILRALDNEPEFPGLRLGLQFGTVVERDGDYYGATVNTAARLTERAQLGQILTTREVRRSLPARDGIVLRDLGSALLKNLPEPLELSSIEDARRIPSTQTLDPVCRMFIDQETAPARLPWADRIWHFCSYECASRFVQSPRTYLGASAP